MKILITGSNGLLGQKIVKLCLKRGVDFLATSVGENRNQDCPSQFYQSMNITDIDNIHTIFKVSDQHTLYILLH